MEDPRRRDVGLFRYSIAREPADPRLSKTERGAIVRALAEIDHTGPDGSRVRVARSTIDRWVRDLRSGGFQGLEGASKGLDAGRMAVAGESVGGDMTAALTLMAKERGDVRFVHAGMYYPVTDAAMDT